MTARPQHQPRQPRLRPAAQAVMGWAGSVLTEAAPEMAGRLRDVRVLRDGPKRLVVSDVGAGSCLVLKQYADDRGAWTRLWLERLTEAGLAPPARFAVTPAQGWSRTHRTLVADLAPGQAWTHWLQAPAADRDAAAAAAGDWLIRLQSRSVALPDRIDYRAGQELRHHSGRLASQHPRHAHRLRRVAEATHRRLYGLDNPRPDLVASHGDLHPENLYVAVSGPLAVTAIDVDTAGLRRPSYDVGYALAQLLVISWMRTGSFSAGAAAGLAFWRRWTARDGRDAIAVSAEVARTLIQSLHFELITYRTGRTELLDRWLDVAESVLTAGVPATFHALTAQEVTL